MSIQEKKKKMAIEAVGHRVVVKPDPVEKKTKSGLIIQTDERLEKAATVIGTVVSIGPEAFRAFNRSAGFKDYFPWVKPGDKVYYAKYAGKFVQDPETQEDFLIVIDEDIVARITGADTAVVASEAT
jgi:co-chaperonin GroES (HSP10)